MGQITVHKNCLFTRSLFEHLFAPFENQMGQINVQLNNSVVNFSSGQLLAPIEIWQSYQTNWNGVQKCPKEVYLIFSINMDI